MSRFLAAAAVAVTIQAQTLPPSGPTMDHHAREVLCHYADSNVKGAAFKAGVALFCGWGGPRDPSLALRYLQAGADQGDPEAMAWLGRMYLRGEGVPKSETSALKWIKASADLGCPLGLYHMGELYQAGFGVPQDLRRYAEFIRKAADKGQADAMAETGQVYKYGLGIQKDEAEAQRWFERASHQPLEGFYPATLAWLYGGGFGFPKDAGKALAYSLQAYQEGYAAGANAIANTFFSGAEGSFPKDYAQALSWAKEAERKQDAQGYTIEGVIEWRGLDGKKDQAAAFAAFQKGAAQNEPFCMLGLGFAYHQGEAAPKDFGLAMSWFKKAADADVSLASTMVGIMYAKGEGVEQDYGRARNAFLKAASQGDLAAELQIGFMYNAGLGVEEDKKIALSWFQKAAASHFPPAENMIGRYYQGGLGGLPKDPGKAVEHYSVAAEAGFTDAIWNMAWAYEHGSGVVQDYAVALTWLDKGEAKQSAICIHELGWFYENGYGVARDPVKAMSYYQRAGGLGHAQSYFQMGWVHEHGVEPIAVDLPSARQDYLKAANMGYSDAEYCFGKMLVEGTGGPADVDEGRKWLEKAARQGDKDAVDILASLDAAKADPPESDSEED